MYVDIYQAGCHIETGNINYLGARAGLNMLGDLDDLVVLDRDVAHCVYPIPGIDDVATLEHKIVRFLTVKRYGRPNAKQQKKLQQVSRPAMGSLLSNSRKEIHDKVSP
jgi:hypothetical protein